MATYTSLSQTPNLISDLLNPGAKIPPTDFNAAIPGFSGLTGQASSVIGNLLNGTPSPQTARNAAAAFGINSGMGPGSGLGENYGANLYTQEAQKNQQAGITDLLGMLGGYAGTVTPTAGQNIQSSQFNQSNALSQFNSMISALGLGGNVVGQGNQQPPQTY